MNVSHSLRFTRIIFAALLSTALITIISLGGFNRAWADESQADEPYESPFVPVSVPFNSSASTMIDPSDVLQSNRCFTFTVPQDMKVHVEMDYLLPCYHGGYLITIVDSKGQELFNDFTPRLTGEMQEYGESYFTKELKKGDYHVEVIYTQSHKTQWGWFSVGAYDDSAYTALHATPLWRTQITMPKTAVSYTGKNVCVNPVVKHGGKTLRKGTDYTVSYKNNKSVGTATVTVTGKGAYKGTKTATFKIVPKGTSVSKLAKAKKAFTVKWKKPSKANLKQTTGYQVRYSLKKSMKGAKTKTVKATSSAGKKCTLKVSKLKAGKKYYVQVRAYKKVGGKTYYSSWSKAKAVKTKK